MAILNTKDIANVFIDCDSLAARAGFSKDVAQSPSPPAAKAGPVPKLLFPLSAFLKFIGINAAAHYRTLAGVLASLRDTMIAGFKVNGDPANIAEFGAAE